MADGPWFEQTDEKELATQLQSQVETLERSPEESTRRSNILYDLELYYGRPITTLYALNSSAVDPRWDPDQLVFNVCYSIVNTIRNRISSFRARAQFLPNGGDYLARRGSRDRTAMSDAWAQEAGWQAEASFALRDMLTSDGGVLKLRKEISGKNGDKFDQVSISRFPPWEFMYDWLDGLYRQPTCAYHVTYLPIEQASTQYRIGKDKLATAIVSAPPGLVYSRNRDMIRIVEAWKRADEGKHVTVVGNEVSGPVEGWEYDGFPLIQRTFDEAPVGTWGAGAITPIRGIQLELNEIQESLREAFRQGASKLIQFQQNEDSAHFQTNAYVQVVPYVNSPAVVTVPPAIDPGVYKYLEVLKAQAYETLGVSPFIATGRKSPGVDSGVAMREESELQSDRLAGLSQVWEGMRVDGATWWDRFSIEIAKDGVQPKWRALHRGAFREIVFGDLEAKWEIRPFPTSVFGANLSGRLDKAVNLIKGGFMSKEDAMKALDLPDLAPIVDQMLAQSYAMEYLIDDILEEGRYVQPDRYIDPVALDSYAKNRYFLAISDGSNYPEKNLSDLRRLIDSNQDRLKKQAANQAAAQAPPPAPMPTPTPPALAGASPEMIAAGAMPAAA